MARYLPIYGHYVPDDIRTMAVAMGMDHIKTYRRAGIECFRPEKEEIPFGKDDATWERLVFYGRARRTLNGYRISRLGMEEVGNYFNVMIIRGTR